MNIYKIALPLLLVLAACSGPKDTPLPRDLEKLDSLTPTLEKLTTEERELVGGYILRIGVGSKLKGVFGGEEGPGIPEGMTIGKAIEEQRKFKADLAIKEAKQQALQAKLASEREAAVKPLREAVTVTLVSKKTVPEYGYSGMLTDEHLQVVFGYQNNTGKDIAGVKGHISIKDLFGEQISGFLVSNDDTLKAGESITWTGSRSVKYGMNKEGDRKLGGLEASKYTVVWEPWMVVFADGTKLADPDKQVSE